jgi:hypothetical protein
MRPNSAQPDFAILLDWVDGRLEPGVAAEVARQVAVADSGTRGTVEWLRRFRATAQALPLHDPPPVIRQNLVQYFARWSRARSLLEQGPVELRGILLFDSRRDVAMSSVRAAHLADEVTPDEVIHLAYRTDSADLVIDIRRLGGRRVRLDGQVLLAQPGAAPVFEAWISGSGFSARTVDGDGLGRFSLNQVPDTARHLRVSNGEFAIVVELDLAADRA